MKIIFREKELELHYSMRIYIIYENIMGTNVDPNDMKSYTSIISLFYAALVASLQYHKMDSNVTYDEFIDWLDDNAQSKINEFSEWFVKSIIAQQDKVDAVQEKELEKQPKSKSKKK